ncbi:hypothetical protein [Antarcticimicrobium sediminis]|uniref:Uncharacterized protein n=1 Tax=Antarcticimicrobium sediminis TaxID=2546227 RepID=A0A4R5EVT9_9RHOB|nr:hypothetical protein [Antarcticimicrobium sediminis]TDE39098.1 hypothetical protein E1B25_08840 [Antarcticimicrobium sediminis]
MPSKLDDLLGRLRDLQEAIQLETEARRAAFRYRVERGRVIFDADMRRRHRDLRESWLSFLSRTRLLVVLSAPLIYALIVPLVLMDLFVSVYQAVCFPVYRIEKVRRADYIAIDRYHLAYLNGLQKLNCVYCGYANGLIAYVREIAGRTEAHWCPIKHARRVETPHEEYGGFVEFGDGEAFRRDLAQKLSEEQADKES